MANKKHLEILKKGVNAWNNWRKSNYKEIPNLSNADLSNKDLRNIDLSFSNLRRVIFRSSDLRNSNLSHTCLKNACLRGAILNDANLNDADLKNADISNSELIDVKLNHAELIGVKLINSLCFDAELNYANLSNACLLNAHLGKAKLENANLSNADLRFSDLQDAFLGNVDFTNAHLDNATLNRANLIGANLSNARLYRAELIGSTLNHAMLYNTNLIEANLMGSVLIKANLNRANMTNCSIYGISSWDVKLEETIQKDLIITPMFEAPDITVDNLEVAQFIYLLLNNEKIRHIIDSITSKVVLILGRFTPDRKLVLEAIKDELRKNKYSPVLFDFEKPSSRSFIETVSTLAHMAKFIIADMTDAKIVLEEVPHIVRNIAVPVKPLLLEGSGKEPITLFNLRVDHISLLDTFYYKDLKHLLASLKREVISPAEAKVKELDKRRK